TLSFGDVSVRIPSTMKVTRVGPSSLAPGLCSAVPFPTSGAFVGTGSTRPFNCPMIPAGVVPVPTDGVWMRPMVHAVGEPLPVKRRLDNGHARLAISDIAFYGPDALTSAIDVRVGGATTVVRIGLGPDPTIARTILASIRPAN